MEQMNESPKIGSRVLWDVVKKSLTLTRPLPHFHAESRPPYFHSLDFARGAAACSILIWHYQHFLALGTASPETRSLYPFYSILRILYDEGGAAVQLFWIISGFVFSTVYFGTRTSAFQFFLSRFGRLYPLHFITMMAVLLLQSVNVLVFGSALIYPLGLRNLGLQLLMASGWTTPPSFSFNGPVWSVSAELLIYALFYAVLPRLFRHGALGPAITAALCLLLSRAPVLTTICLCGFYFFTGCIIYACHRILHELPLLRTSLAAATIVCSLVVIHFVGQGLGVMILFAGVVMLLASVNRWWPAGLTQLFGWLGDSTYGIYLWHIPIQLTLLLALRLTGLRKELALSPFFFVLYIVLVLLVAQVSFRLFEVPLRTLISGKRPKGGNPLVDEFGSSAHSGH